MIEIRPATTADLLSFYGKPSTRTVRAFSVLRDSEIVAIAGISITSSVITFFSDIKEGLNAPKIAIWRVAKEIVQRVREFNLPVYAIANCNIAGADKFLEALGFKFLHEINNQKTYQL